MRAGSRLGARGDAADHATEHTTLGPPGSRLHRRASPGKLSWATTRDRIGGDFRASVMHDMGCTAELYSCSCCAWTAVYQLEVVVVVVVVVHATHHGRARRAAGPMGVPAARPAPHPCQSATRELNEGRRPSGAGPRVLPLPYNHPLLPTRDDVIVDAGPFESDPNVHPVIHHHAVRIPPSPKSHMQRISVSTADPSPFRQPSPPAPLSNGSARCDA